MELNLQDKCSKQTITRSDGEIIARVITESWEKEEKIIIDFNNILIASVSFFDEAFGKLAFEYSKEDLVKKISFINLQEYDRALVNDIIISRYHQRELGQNGPSKPKKRKKAKVRSSKIN